MYYINVFLVLLLSSHLQCDQINYIDDDEDTMEMFPEPKVHMNCDLTKIDKLSFCQDSCTDSCKKNVENNNPNIEKSNGTPIYTADGVYTYYKTFVQTFLEQISYESLINYDDYEVNLKLKVELSQHDIKKLYIFSKYETKIENSSIQDVTDIFKSMILDVEKYTMDTTFIVWKNTLEQYLGLDIKLLFGGIAFIILCVIFVIILLKSNILVSLNWRKIILLCILILFVYTAINNYFYLIQKKELLKKAHLASYIPEECFNHDNKPRETGIFSTIKNYFRHSPTSKVCLEYSEAIMIDSFIKVNLVEVLVYTIFESLRPIFIYSGEFVNKFYVGLSKDLSFYQYMPLFVWMSIIVPIVLILLFVLLCCDSINLFHMISLNKSKKTFSAEDVLQLRRNIAIEICSNLVKTFPVDSVDLSNGNDSIEKLTQNIQKCIEKKNIEINNKKDELEKVNKKAIDSAKPLAIKVKNDGKEAKNCDAQSQQDCDDYDMVETINSNSESSK